MQIFKFLLNDRHYAFIFVLIVYVNPYYSLKGDVTLIQEMMSPFIAGTWKMLVFLISSMLYDCLDFLLIIFISPDTEAIADMFSGLLGTEYCIKYLRGGHKVF